MNNLFLRSGKAEPRTVARDFAGKLYEFTVINCQLHLMQKQACAGLGIGKQPFRNHVDTLHAEYLDSYTNLGGVTPSPPQDDKESLTQKGISLPLIPEYLLVYEAEVNFQREEVQWGGGGGKQRMRFYHHELVVQVAFRTENTPEKQAFIKWVRRVVSDYVKDGVAINRPALTYDTSLAEKAIRKVGIYANFTKERHAMLQLNKTISRVFFSCTGAFNEDGSVNKAAWIYFHRCFHNTAHIATVGMNAKQIRYVRADPTSFTFGQDSFAGVVAPRNDELKNACNFLDSIELYIRSAIISRAVGTVLRFIRELGDVHYKQALQMVTMQCADRPFTKDRKPFIELVSPNWFDYPETAVDNIVNMPPDAEIFSHLREAAKTYVQNFPNRHDSNSPEAIAWHVARQAMIDQNVLDTYSEDAPEIDDFELDM